MRKNGMQAEQSRRVNCADSSYFSRTVVGTCTLKELFIQGPVSNLSLAHTVSCPGQVVAGVGPSREHLNHTFAFKLFSNTSRSCEVCRNWMWLNVVCMTDKTTFVVTELATLYFRGLCVLLSPQL